MVDSLPFDLNFEVYREGGNDPRIQITDKYENLIYDDKLLPGRNSIKLQMTQLGYYQLKINDHKTMMTREFTLAPNAVVISGQKDTELNKGVTLNWKAFRGEGVQYEFQASQVAKSVCGPGMDRRTL